MDTTILSSNTQLVSNVVKSEEDALEIARVTFIAKRIVERYTPFKSFEDVVSHHLLYAVRQLEFWLTEYNENQTVDNFDKLQANIRLYLVARHYDALTEEYKKAMRKIGYIVGAPQ